MTPYETQANLLLDLEWRVRQLFGLEAGPAVTTQTIEVILFKLESLRKQSSEVAQTKVGGLN